MNDPIPHFFLNTFLGKVPALLDGSDIIIESLDISDYLDEKYPENPLYPSDLEVKKQDKELIQKIETVTSIFTQVFFQDKTPEEWVKAFLVPLQVFEDALAKRGTLFFGGEKPGMVCLLKHYTYIIICSPTSFNLVT